MTHTLPPSVRQLVASTWVDRVSDWPDEVWQTWATELDGFTPGELLAAVRIYARRGSAFPPSWGEVYAIAKPVARQRLERASAAAWQGEPT